VVALWPRSRCVAPLLCRTVRIFQWIGNARTIVSHWLAIGCARSRSSLSLAYPTPTYSYPWQIRCIRSSSRLREGCLGVLFVANPLAKAKVSNAESDCRARNRVVLPVSLPCTVEPMRLGKSGSRSASASGATSEIEGP
jgi:hypothetical protein